jgi:hypothetical protein
MSPDPGAAMSTKRSPRLSARADQVHFDLKNRVAFTEDKIDAALQRTVDPQFLKDIL